MFTRVWYAMWKFLLDLFHMIWYRRHRLQYAHEKATWRWASEQHGNTMTIRQVLAKKAQERRDRAELARTHNIEELFDLIVKVKQNLRANEALHPDIRVQLGDGSWVLVDKHEAWNDRLLID